MGIVQMTMWAVVSVLAYVPASWITTWVTDGDLPDGNLKKFLVGTIVCWGVAALMVAFLRASARELRERKAREQREMATLQRQPLRPVLTKKVATRSGEEAYATVRGQLQDPPAHEPHGPAQAGVPPVGGLGSAAGLAHGELVVTDRRVIFAGGAQSFAIELDHLMASTEQANGFCFRNGQKAYTVHIPNERERTQFRVVLRKVLRARLAAAEVAAA